jgi:salicylate hydroxylase
MKILIAGAGIGGLSAAACLLQAGHDVHILEQAPELIEIGAGIQISANAMHVLVSLGLGDEISAMSVRPQAYVFRLHDTGEVLSQFALADEHLRLHRAPYNQLHRADFQQLLAGRVRELRKDAIRLNARVAGFEETASGVRVRLASGETVDGDLLIGADGVKSAVRAQIAGAAQPVYTGDAAWRLTIPTKKLPPGFMGPVMSVWMGPGAHAVCYYLRAGALLNFVGLVETDEVSEESWTARFPWQKLKADFAGWHPDIQTVIDLGDPDACYRWSLFYRPPISNWSTRRATLLGDAVHATLPYLAQGAAMAIEDAVQLAGELDRHRDDLPAAFAAYQQARYLRTARVQVMARVYGEFYHARGPTAELRDMMLGARTPEQAYDGMAWLYGEAA